MSRRRFDPRDLVFPPPPAPRPRNVELHYPTTPGLPPSWQGAYETVAEAEVEALSVSRRRPDLHGQDIRIQWRDGQLIRHAGGAP